MEMEKKREIKHRFHEHPLVFVEDQINEGEKAYCSACGDVISDPCFSCAPCNYHLHNNCALAPQTISSHPLHPQHRYGHILPSITRVVEVSEDGEATKIEHFWHEGHCLVLADKMEEETDRRCDGCMLPVSTLFYYCSESECHFYLHKNCAELPRVKRHWFRRLTATLYSTSFRHFLFYDFKCRELCNGCGADTGRYGAFRCGKCSFTLDFKCLSLPQSVVHKFDQHQLNLTYHEDNDYSKHLHCDICEGKRDPNLWYYCCSTCDTSAHPDCILGEFPFIKDGITLPRPYGYGHPHKLRFLRKAEDYPNCWLCGQRCRREILKCTESTCNYIMCSAQNGRFRGLIESKEFTNENDFAFPSYCFED
ncbi:uncharacterized protein LOC120144779 [Hibiscus syriacus]|uniref:uncharacterized protein LOC120144779 n=1 Tax=Hibiscus syriacus TaxID=106335 RepID=UPI001920828E|nr:uncharacterized protein LOC120144779 [Hibiscus syriacus]